MVDYASNWLRNGPESHFNTQNLHVKSAVNIHHGLHPVALTTSACTELSTCFERVLRQARQHRGFWSTTQGVCQLSSRAVTTTAAALPEELAAHQQEHQVPCQQAARGSAAAPLQQQLAAGGVRHWAQYSHAHHDKLNAEAEGYVAKVVELSREGLEVEDVDRLFLRRHRGVSKCSLEVFLPNLALLRHLTAGQPFERRPNDPEGLTLLGRMLRNMPSDTAMVLARKPALIFQLVNWVIDEAGVSHAQLSACVVKSPGILSLSAPNARAVLELFGRLGMSQEECRRQLLTQPRTFAAKPASVSRKLATLRGALQLRDSREAVKLVVSMPKILTSGLQHLGKVALELDALLGKSGAGADLIRRQPALTRLSSLQQPLSRLRGMGVKDQELAGLVARYPLFLNRNLESAVFRQKLQWAEEELGYSLSQALSGGFLFYGLRRLASRLAFIKHLGLARPPHTLLSQPDQTFFSKVSRRAGREVRKPEFDAFLRQWLQAEEGMRWGFVPDKDRSKRGYVDV